MTERSTRELEQAYATALIALEEAATVLAHRLGRTASDDAEGDATEAELAAYLADSDIDRAVHLADLVYWLRDERIHLPRLAGRLWGARPSRHGEMVWRILGPDPK